MPGFWSKGFDRYIVALEEEFTLRVTRLETSASGAATADERESLLREAKELRAELKRRVNAAGYSFF